MTATGPATFNALPRADAKIEAQGYRPYGAALELMRCREPEVLISGPAGTGKSRACLEKMHLAALKYAGLRGLILRKTRESLTESALVTFEQKVLPANSPIKEGAQRRMRQSYDYPNGSTLVVGGLDKASKVFSTEYDLIYLMEAIEATEDDWETCTTRLRAGVVPYQQIVADTNPGPRTHWLKRRADTGLTRLLDSTHDDNPAVTPEYIAKLDRLTGVRYLRLRKGLWVSAEGMIYEGWDPTIHPIDRFDVPREWPRYWVFDFGFTNPFVWQEWARDDDGRLYRLREIYHTGRLVEDHARQIGELMKDEPRPQALICDTDAEDRATLERHLGLRTLPAFKSVSPGIQAVASRMRSAGDGRARVFFLRDSLIERDADLTERKRPCCTEEEVEGYVWDTTEGRKKGEEPLKQDDHGCDCLRYLVAHVDRLTNEEAKNPLRGNFAMGISRGW